ncbi:tRNA (adenosine(37)-N6)-threonylcarbamoyltransferase complex ATPase subunit type 1 TsaE [Candidatus Levyibacteriota bacterium]|nr:tRNA (adenosine(37)-N6)-threonylcarbamoyltransferase complex ATPase subunit type 1 TsaE [Candidatus Levybacteria bacterium]MSU25663.1 tRNA (adenosine(37)-N6)-threonylcarbamoyltransferase complex ATPase subunit type 1 TsaE [Candidatus Levybacteria bacterium]GDX61731.1 tRNA (adenosine(37)-N6)-threonylcarbamoyltransferase complex ATPase subunit type 1 TsaE [Candidatus Levybacteria bacterium]
MILDNFIVISPKEMIDLGVKFSKQIKAGDIIVFRGTLGSGKTTFIQGMAKGIGVQQRIVSPTFMIARTYDINNGNIHHFYHMDLYRLDDEKNISSFGFNEMIEDEFGVTVIEWSEKLKEKMPKYRWEVSCEYDGDSKRVVVIRKY